MSCFPDPGFGQAVHTWPTELATEVEEEAGEYIFDTNFQEQGADFVLQQVFAMTERRFKVARRFVKDKPGTSS